jgi:CelD/BcsL family acetyltransferase involved in cellulose biosynthesis
MSHWSFSWVGGDRWYCDDRLTGQWQALLDRATLSTVFHELPMISAWMMTKGQALGFAGGLCEATSSNGNVALLPVCRGMPSWSNLWHQRLVFVGEPHFDYQEPLFASPPREDELHEFWRGLEVFLEAHGHCDSSMALRIREQLGVPSFAPDDSGESPFIDMTRYGSFSDYLQTRPANHRTDVRRRIRRLEELGTLRLEVLAPGAESARLLDMIVALRAAYEELWSGQPSEILFRQSGTWDFYREFAPRMHKCGMLHASVLCLDEVPISWHLGFLRQGVLHWYKPTYLKSMEDYSPGKAHLALLLSRGFVEGWHEFDFGCGMEAYKYRWADSLRRMVSWHWKSWRLGPMVRRSFRSGFKRFRALGVNVLS